MTNMVHGNVRPGVFLTGTFDFFAVTTQVPAYPTNVKAPLADVLTSLNVTTLSSTNKVTIVDGNGASHDYTSDAAYTTALNKQTALDRLIQTFALRANPVMVSVAQSGSDYIINLATERSPLWMVGEASPSNVNGYNFLDAIDGVPAWAGGTAWDKTSNISVAERTAL